MRSAPDDRTSRAIIRDEALRLFAARGADAVTVRQIAAAASVSPALVVRHFGSKDGLREEVDQHVLRVFDAAIGQVATGDIFDPEATGSMVDVLLRHLPPDSPVPRYLGRMLLEGSEAGRVLFQRIFDVGQSILNNLIAVGAASPGADPKVRAAFLTANDLAVLILREHLAEWIGVDPLSKAGMTRWGGEVLAIYDTGLAEPKGESQ